MFAWVLIIFISNYHGGPATIPNIPTEGDCHYLANKIKAQGSSVFAYGVGPYTCTKYKTR